MKYALIIIIATMIAAPSPAQPKPAPSPPPEPTSHVASQPIHYRGGVNPNPDSLRAWVNRLRDGRDSIGRKSMGIAKWPGSGTTRELDMIQAGQEDNASRMKAYKDKMNALMARMRLAPDKAGKKAVVDEIRRLRIEQRQLHARKADPPTTLKNNLKPHKQPKPGPDAAIPPLPPTVSAPRVYHLPFGSTGNRIELSIQNASAREIINAKVSITTAPAWAHIQMKEQLVEKIAPNGNIDVVFIISVDKSAPVGKEQRLTFNINSGLGESWTKEVSISVSAPERFELFQNYPNPFNPLTVIGYQLSVGAQVQLKIFNLLGQEVATLVDLQQEAGYHEATWDASQAPSGVYFYQLTYDDLHGRTGIDRKKMTVVK